MKISSVNVQNRYKQKNYVGIDNGLNINELLVNYLVENNIDVAGTQELVPSCIPEITQKLNNYKIVGDTRFKGLFAKIRKRYNETTSIIAKEKIVFTETIHLPWFPSTLPRIATICVLKTKNDGQLCFINTHLDFLLSSVQKRQLAFLKKIIQKYQVMYPIILTGDFNMNLDDKKFVKFINELEDIGIIRVPINEKTFRDYENNSPIDHIFVSNNFEIVDYKVVKEDKYNFADHYPIECVIKKRS